ncbi:PhoH family protein [Bacillus sp. S13(2024)]|uniref:PhoH family protein n=1 Tax=Bacillus sp. S13(2024) TaxID=3162885 RepID=UPI003D1D1F98
MDKLFVADTNILVDSIEALQDYKIVLLSHTLRELENHKSSRDEDLKYKARKASRYINENREQFHFDVRDYDGSKLGIDYDKLYQDNNILAACVQNGYGLITNDVLLGYKGEGFGLDVVSFDNKSEENDEYYGYKEVYMTDAEYKEFYQTGLNDNKFGLLVNEYLIILDDVTGEDIDGLLWDGKVFHSVRKRGFKTDLLGDFKPRDYYQACLLDSMQRNKITMANGKAGSGKTLVTLSYSVQQLEKGKIKHIICFVNTVPVKGAQQLGYYKGTKDEKLLDASIGNMLGSKFGNKFILEQMIAKEELILLPMVDIRGFDSTGMNAHIHMLEAQNADKELMKLSIQRVGDDCKLFIDGDFQQQVDSSVFEGRNNGMRRVSEVFRGRSCYGQVRLPKVLRSEIASIADLM